MVVSGPAIDLTSPGTDCFQTDIVGTADMRSHMQTDKIQTLYQHAHRHFFPVVVPVRGAVLAGPGLNRVRSPSPVPLGDDEAVGKLLERLEAHKGMEDGGGDADKELSNWLYVTGIWDFVEELKETGKKTGGIAGPQRGQ